jgi:hypothetical protein
MPGVLIRAVSKPWKGSFGCLDRKRWSPLKTVTRRCLTGCTTPLPGDAAWPRRRKPEPLKRALVGINLGSLQALNRVYGFHYTWDLIKRVSDTLAGFSSGGRQLFSMYEHHFAFYLKGYGDRKDLNGFCFAVTTALRQLLTVERIDIGIGVIEIDEQNSLSAEQFFKSLLISSEKALEFYDDDKGLLF